MSSKSRIGAAFERAKAAGRPALIAYLIPGYPEVGDSDAVFDAVIEGGADMVEVGIPFSDPLADGATIQRAAFEALQNGTTPSACIEFVRRARSRHSSVPIVFMSYLNPVLSYGLEAFAKDAAGAGADGCILVDLPVEEAADASAVLARNGLDLVLLVAPTSTEDRIRRIAALASGFLYCVSVTGVTGARDKLPADLLEFLARVRGCTNLPLAVGFGMSRRDHVEALTGVADGVVVGTAIVNLLGATARPERSDAIRAFIEVLSGRRVP
jgi:tryptophan synthase alpha chain